MRTCATCRKFKVCEFSPSAESLFKSFPMFSTSTYELTFDYIGHNVIGHIHIGQKYFGLSSIGQNDFGRNVVLQLVDLLWSKSDFFFFFSKDGWK